VEGGIAPGEIQAGRAFPDRLPGHAEDVLVPAGLVGQDEAQHLTAPCAHHEARRRDLDGDARGRLERLTPREIQILEAMAAGRQPEEIAAQLGMSPNTLRTHTQNVLTKLRVHSKMEALVLAIRYGKVATVDLTEIV